MANNFLKHLGPKKVIGSSFLAGLVLIGGLSWALAEGAKSTKAEATGTEKNAISVSDDEHCKKPMADCAKHDGAGEEKTSGAANSSSDAKESVSEADCPRPEKCPKGMHGAKSGECCKKHSMGATKTGHNHAAAQEAIAKPVEAPKSKN